MIKKNHILLIDKNKCKQYFLILLITFFNLITTYAQQVPQYTQYLYNMQTLNPAFVGSRADLSISLLSRQQWVGIEGAPTTQTFSINGRTSKGLGLGVTIVNDKIGLAASTNMNIDASYTIITSQYARLALGLKGGVTLFDNNLSQAITSDNDIYASTNGNATNVGFGALFYNQKFFVGLSVPYLLKTSIFKTNNSNATTNITNHLNYFLSSGIRFQLSENFMFKPSTLVKYATNLPLSVDINSNFLYNEKIEAGISYRYNDSVSLLFAIILKEKFRIGYAYDYKLANFGSNLSSHEIVLHIDLNLKRNERWLRHNKCYF